MSNTARWTFASPTPVAFDDHAERSIPSYRAGHDLVLALSDFFAVSEVLDVGCSTGALTAALAQRHPSCRVTGVDAEADMIAVARQRYDAPNLTFCGGSALHALEATSDVDLIVAYHLVQFLLPAQRRALLHAAHDAPRPGGALVMFEKCRAASSLAHDVETQLYHDFKLRHGLDAYEVLAKSRALRGVMHTLNDADSDAQLRAVGFHAPHTIHRHLGFRGVLALRPS